MDHYTLEPANHDDYRDFLKARFESLRAKNPRFSLAACAKRSRMSKSFLQFIFNKKRHVALDRMPVLATALKLTGDEEYFVYLMACKDSSRSAAIRSHFEKILDRVRHAHVAVLTAAPVIVAEDQKELYLHHLFVILQKLVKLEGFREDPKWLNGALSLPDISGAAALEILREMEAKGFLKRDSSGRLVSGPEDLWRPDHFDPSGHAVFTRAAESVARLMQTPTNYRPSVYMSMALSMDEAHLLKAEKLMIEMHHQLVELSNASREPTAVAYYGNFMLTVARLKGAGKRV